MSQMLVQSDLVMLFVRSAIYGENKSLEARWVTESKNRTEPSFSAVPILLHFDSRSDEFLAVAVCTVRTEIKWSKTEECDWWMDVRTWFCLLTELWIFMVVSFRISVIPTSSVMIASWFFLSWDSSFDCISCTKLTEIRNEAYFRRVIIFVLPFAQSTSSEYGQ